MHHILALEGFDLPLSHLNLIHWQFSHEDCVFTHQRTNYLYASQCRRKFHPNILVLTGGNDNDDLKDGGNDNGDLKDGDNNTNNDNDNDEDGDSKQ